MVEALVEFDYNAQEPDELTIKKGDIISNIDRKPGGWWEGTLSHLGRRGMFPDNFVKILNEDGNKTADRKTSVGSGGGKKCKVLFAYSPVNEDELELHVNDVIELLGEVEEGWWRGKLRNRIGVFPSNFVTEISESVVREAATRKLKPEHPLNNTADKDGETETQPQGAGGAHETPSPNAVAPNAPNAISPPAPVTPALPPKPLKEVCKALYGYDAVNEDELSFKEGDVITILSKEGQDVGWWKGELKGKVGVFPDNFVQVIEQVAKAERPPAKSTTNLARDAITKSSSFALASSLPVSRKLSDSDKASPPVISKKPLLPPPTTKKPQSVSAPDLSKSPPKPGVSARSPLSSSPSSAKAKEDSTASAAATTTTTANNATPNTNSTSTKWSVALETTSDSTDGSAWSRQSYSVSSATSGTSTISVGGLLLTDGELNLDMVSREDMLKHPTATRPKAPRRRPPSAILKEEQRELGSPPSPTTPPAAAPSHPLTTLVNGAGGGGEHPTPPSGGGAPGPKTTAPWMEELKQSQAKKQGMTRVMIGPAQDQEVNNIGGGLSKPVTATRSSVDVTKSSVSSMSMSHSAVTLRSSFSGSVTGQPRPQSMCASSAPSRPQPDAPTLLSPAQWTWITEQLAKVDQLKLEVDTLNQSLKQLTEALEDERHRRRQMQLEIEKLTDVVTQV